MIRTILAVLDVWTGVSLGIGSAWCLVVGVASKESTHEQ